MPTIRMHLLEGVYNSIKESFHGEWELVLITPYPLPEELKDKDNILYIKDDGNPIRCRQRGIIAARGEAICYAADDVTFYPNSLDIAYKTLINHDYKTVIVGKYLEGCEDNPFMKSDEYWFLYTHDFLKPIIRVNQRRYLLMNTGLMSKQLLMEIGGFDCSFEACAMACCDLSIRLQNYGVKCILQNEPIFHSTHLPVDAGDHALIHSAQVTHDQPRFLQMYLDPRSEFRTKIDVNNWEKTPDWWVRRFGVKDEA